jgi:hypothetical protein
MQHNSAELLTTSARPRPKQHKPRHPRIDYTPKIRQAQEIEHPANSQSVSSFTVLCSWNLSLALSLLLSSLVLLLEVVLWLLLLWLRLLSWLLLLSLLLWCCCCCGRGYGGFITDVVVVLLAEVVVVVVLVVVVACCCCCYYCCCRLTSLASLLLSHFAMRALHRITTPRRLHAGYCNASLTLGALEHTPRQRIINPRATSRYRTQKMNEPLETSASQDYLLFNAH